ncbi:hypothetical protein EDB86DRAFT_2830654 [Lactarius hatsudake]|nr:hypothetical protein EDB86DRAFT_2830654 [Lactarius hatsudake]
MTHIIGLDEEAHQSVINNLLLMGMGDFTPGIATPQINAIGLCFAPSPPDTPNTMPLDLTPGTALSVPDDNTSGRGVKTSASASVLILPKPVVEPPRLATPIAPHNPVLPAPAQNEILPQTLPSRPPRSPLRNYQPIFPANAFERPRDPDEVRPQIPSPTPQTQNRVNATGVAPVPSSQPPNMEVIRINTVNTHGQTSDSERSRRHHRTQAVINPADARQLRRTLYATNDDIHRWLQRIVHEPPPRPRYRPPQPLGNITEERTNTDLELREYGYDRTYDHAGKGQNN